MISGISNIESISNKVYVVPSRLYFKSLYWGNGVKNKNWVSFFGCVLTII